MTKRFTNPAIKLLMLLLLYSWSAVAQQSERLNLSWLPVAGHAEPIIDVYAIVKPIQRVDSGEFFFTLAIANKSLNKIKIANPFNYIFFSLINNSGQETIFLQESKAAREPHDDTPIFQTYNVKSVHLNKKPIIFNPWQSDSLILLPASSFEAKISITQFWNTKYNTNNTPYKPASAEQVSPLKSGLYRFRIQLNIVERKKYWILISKFLPVKILK